MRESTPEELDCYLYHKNLCKVMSNDIKLYKIMNMSYAVSARYYGALMWQNQVLAKHGNDKYESSSACVIRYKTSGGGTLTIKPYILALTYCFSLTKGYRPLRPGEVLLEFSLHDVINFANSLGNKYACGRVTYCLPEKPPLLNIVKNGDIYVSCDPHRFSFGDLPCLISNFRKGRGLWKENEYRLSVDFREAIGDGMLKRYDKYACFTGDTYRELVMDLFSKAKEVAYGEYPKIGKKRKGKHKRKSNKTKSRKVRKRRDRKRMHRR